MNKIPAEKQPDFELLAEELERELNENGILQHIKFILDAHRVDSKASTERLAKRIRNLVLEYPMMFYGTSRMIYDFYCLLTPAIHLPDYDVYHRDFQITALITICLIICSLRDNVSFESAARYTEVMEDAMRVGSLSISDLQISWTSKASLLLFMYLRGRLKSLKT